MPFNGSGVFTRNYAWVNDAANSIPITASRMDADTNDIASGLSNCITRDGQSPAQANIPMGGFRFTNAGPAVLGTEYVTLNQANSLYALAYTPVNKAGDTMTGQLNVPTLAASSYITMTGSGGLPASGGFQPYYAGTTGGNVVGIVVIGDGSGWNYSFVRRVGSTNAIAFNFKDDGSFNCGSVTAAGAILSTGTITAQGELFQGSSANAVLGTTGSGGTVFLRPNGATNGTGQLTMASTGIATAVNFNATSDARLKDDIQTFTPRDLTDIRLTTFVWKDTGAEGLSPIAQEVRSRAPEYVSENDDVLAVDKAGLALERVAYLEDVLRKAGLL